MTKVHMRGTRGFTLIELLVTIGIMALYLDVANPINLPN